MTQFYVDREGDVRRCKESILDRKPITITGLTEDGHVRAFTGAVQSVQENKLASLPKRWLITMIDED